ncbi:Aste57867_491 [Aphanomyces stellatus]|uniref:Aste57867_491 protein n=1 Tax=Aphanomyces stellatus TaxID=120398 RepID=A0A485K3R5_9STRA|nr:hypothetical protein As57867_000490 [Aphanomyces stellatus]VFT77716.1 Aste57867_491 [Aphanomyces stellatus]
MYVLPLQTNAAMNHFYMDNATTTTFDMIPWQHCDGYAHFGGSPLCYDGSANTYPQQSFGLDDACTDSEPHLSIDGQRKDVTLSLFFQANTSEKATCGLNQDSIEACIDSLTIASTLLAMWSAQTNLGTLTSLILSATVDVSALDIIVSLMQFAMLNNTPLLLVHPLVYGANSPWSFNGWLYLLHWLGGTREVVSFDGDVSSLVLVSKPFTQTAYAADPMKIPNRFSHVLWLVMCYMPIVLAVVLAVALAFAATLHGDFCGLNLCFHSPVAGIVWIGRPLISPHTHMAQPPWSTPVVRSSTLSSYRVRRCG